MTETNTPPTANPNSAPAIKTPKEFFAQDIIKTKFTEILGKRSSAFIASILQCVMNNELLAKAEPLSVFNAACVAATMDLPINANLGFAYIIPYKTTVNSEPRIVAQFQMGYKGFIQLAQRSGLYKTISACEIYEGQLIESNPLTGYKFDFSKRKSDKIVGFAAYFGLINGFEKSHYMTIEQMNAHGLKFSKTYANNASLWKTDLIGMGCKTILKLTLSKYGPLSIELQTAVKTDQGIILNEDGSEVSYLDNPKEQGEPIDKELERITLMINDCKTLDQLEWLEQTHPDIDVKLFAAKKEELKNTDKKGAKK